MTKVLRPYQYKAIQECWDSLKKNNDPVLLMASVGSGKSLMLAEILLTIQKLNKRALCIVNNAELVRNNAETFKNQGGKPSIYCAALNYKDTCESIIFGTPQSILNGIKRNEPISNIKFNLIVVDEAHMISYHEKQSTFMRILRHYKQQYKLMRLLGATGTDFRYKGHTIVGDECLFKSKVGNITTAYLIENGFLTKPKFTIDPNEINFNDIKINSMGLFDYKQLENVIQKNTRLTEIIIKNLTAVMISQNRFGAFIFASTKRHAKECLSYLPKEQSALITGDTPHNKRMEILEQARAGIIKYLVNVSVLTVGVDVAPYDTLLFVRPTESLVLMVQMIGRVLRLAPNKTNALIIDCAGNIMRHADWDDPVLIDAVKQIAKPDEEKPFECQKCHTMNGLHARRCIGMENNKRCDYYFEFKECLQCHTKNDLVARECRSCKTELIDPNEKLSLTPFVAPTIKVLVLKAKYWITGFENKLKFHAQYYYVAPHAKPTIITESFSPAFSEKAKNLFYGKFVKECVPNASETYPHLNNPIYLKKMLERIVTPRELTLKFDGNKWSIWKRHFLQDMKSIELLPHPSHLHTQPHNHD
ncbi:MAG: DEAD/DEAH box helicase [Candidatus Nitrosocosmicus sp.]